MTEKKQILKSASIISLITVFSRILGYFRDQRIALLLGTSPAADAFVLAYRLPSLLRRLVGEGSMTAAFIPVMAKYMANHTEEEVWEFANRLFWTAAAVLVTFSVLGMVFSAELSSVLGVFAPDRSQWEAAASLSRIMLPYVAFIGLAALSMAILNSFHVFGTPAATPIVLNIAIIACSIGVIGRYFPSPEVALAAGVLIGGVLQFLLPIPQLVRRGMTFDFGVSFRHPGVRSVAALTLPGFFGIGVAHINFFVGTMFAATRTMPPGSPTALYVAERMMELVLGGYALAVATAILPLMSQQAATGDFAALKSTLTFSLRIVSFLTIPAAVGLIVMREPIIQVLFEHGQFGADSTSLTSQALFYFAFGLPAFAAIRLIVPAFYSSHDTRTPVLIAAWAVGLNLVLNILFLLWFVPVFGSGGPALATVAAGYFNFLALFVAFLVRFGAVGASHILRSLARIALSAGLMGGVAWLGVRASRPLPGQEAFLPQLGALLVLILACAAVYLGLAWLLRCDEMREVYGIALRTERGVMPPWG